MDAYRLSLEIHARFKREARPGAVAGDLYDRVIGWVEKAGWADCFMGFGDGRINFVGHGLGIEVDEYPFIAQGAGDDPRGGHDHCLRTQVHPPGSGGWPDLRTPCVVTREGLESLNTATEELVAV